MEECKPSLLLSQIKFPTPYKLHLSEFIKSCYITQLTRTARETVLPVATQHIMCRWMIYKGRDEILLSKLILEPSHSILTQSYDARLRLVRVSIRGAIVV